MFSIEAKMRGLQVPYDDAGGGAPGSQAFARRFPASPNGLSGAPELPTVKRLLRRSSGCLCDFGNAKERI
jgi:hypothetical protein